jgi:hypothetical protein
MIPGANGVPKLLFPVEGKVHSIPMLWFLPVGGYSDVCGSALQMDFG